MSAVIYMMGQACVSEERVPSINHSIVTVDSGPVTLFCTIDWLAYNEASGVPSLSKSTIEKITVSVPAIETQDKIVSILDAVEHKIHMDRSVLRSYEVQKNYLLSRMFI